MTSDNFNNIQTKKQFLDKITEVMERKITIHSRKINALSESKLHSESASIYMKRLKVNYNQADNERMHWKNLLAHHAFSKILDNEVYKDIRKSIASELSACGMEKTLKLDELIVKLKSIEVDRVTNGL